MPEKFGGRPAPACFTSVSQTLDAERFTVGVKRVRQSVGEKQHRIPRLNPYCRYVVGDRRIEQARRYSLDFQQSATSLPKMQRAGHAGAGDLHFPSARIK